MNFFVKSDKNQSILMFLIPNSSYYHELKNLYQRIGKKHIQLNIFKLFVSSLLILGVFQEQIILGAMMP